ncbi:MAG: hypothetical protein EHM45_15385 [Desulfobacteraceae bacterium]|nr:MAG: hypothetical protein EHM45_15385 [Desulfobacteraceae bacterium]
MFLEMKEEKSERLQEVIEGDWRDSVSSMEYYIDELAKDIDHGAMMNALAVRDWCKEIEGLLTDLSQNLFSLDEPEWFQESDRRKLEELRQKVEQLNGKCKNIMITVH